jgi:hypothetical protein
VLVEVAQPLLVQMEEVETTQYFLQIHLLVVVEVVQQLIHPRKTQVLMAVRVAVVVALKQATRRGLEVLGTRLQQTPLKETMVALVRL